jgi:hypothetical protein
MGRARAVNGRLAPRLRVGRCPLRATAHLSAQPEGPRLKTSTKGIFILDVDVLDRLAGEKLECWWRHLG